MQRILPIFMVFSLCVMACTTTKGVVVDEDILAHGRKVMRAPAVNPPFWEIRSGDRVSYVLGTIHGGVASGELPARIMLKLGESKVAYFENAAGIITSDFSLIADHDLEDLVSPKAWATLKERSGLEESRLRRLTPAAAALYLTVAELERVAVSRQAALDYELEEEARRRGIAIRSLDTKELLEAALRNFELPAADLSRMLEDDRAYAAFLRYLFKWVEAYKRGIEMPQDRDARPGAVEAALDDVVVHRRNLAWIETLVPELKRGAVFIAVGMDHLPGEKGLIQLLRRRGFEIRKQ